MGKIWQDEMEMGNLKQLALKLYNDVKELYKLLHAYVRFQLQKVYNLRLGRGPIPAHLLGMISLQHYYMIPLFPVATELLSFFLYFLCIVQPDK